VLLVTIDALRADRLGLYGHRRPTSPRLDALGRAGAVFEQAYTHWPKTRGSFTILLTGRRPSRNGYSRSHPALHAFNPTLAGVLREAGYRTAAIVDNGNLARSLGYAQGFEEYREVWEEAGSEWERTRRITEGGRRLLAEARPERPFFLWLHYVNPHAPYAPPPPHDTAFLDAEARGGPELPTVPGFFGGIPKALLVPGRTRLGFYLAQYDGEVAAVDGQLGAVLDALEASPARGRTVVVVTSDHGESLGEHDYFFDHGANLFDPSLRVPLVVVVPGAPGGVRSAALASTLDVVPTILDAVKVAYPPELDGVSLLPAASGGSAPPRARLYAENDRGMAAVFDARFKLVATPGERGGSHALYDRRQDPAETRDASSREAEVARRLENELARYLQACRHEAAATAKRLAGAPGAPKLSPEACENMKALGYVDEGCAP
jgi:arylsulfatase A-like enzyme